SPEFPSISFFLSFFLSTEHRNVATHLPRNYIFNNCVSTNVLSPLRSPTKKSEQPWLLTKMKDRGSPGQAILEAFGNEGRGPAAERAPPVGHVPKDSWGTPKDSQAPSQLTNRRRFGNVVLFVGRGDPSLPAGEERRGESVGPKKKQKLTN